MEEFLFYFIREIRFPYGWKPVNSCHCLPIYMLRWLSVDYYHYYQNIWTGQLNSVDTSLLLRGCYHNMLLETNRMFSVMVLIVWKLRRCRERWNELPRDPKQSRTCLACRYPLRKDLPAFDTRIYVKACLVSARVKSYVNSAPLDSCIDSGLTRRNGGFFLSWLIVLEMDKGLGETERKKRAKEKKDWSARKRWTRLLTSSTKILFQSLFFYFRKRVMK